MPRKKKTSDNVNGENMKNAGKQSSENDIENEKQLDANSIDSKSLGTSSISLKKHFSFAKRKKNQDPYKSSKTNQDNNGKNHVGDLRRTNSLNNISQESSNSKIPILKHRRHDNKHSSKHELCPRSQKHGNCESRSLVLNPGMDSWRMAGLMDTVSNTYSSQTLNSVTSISDYHKPPNIALCSGGLSKDRTISLEKVENEKSVNCIPRLVTTNENVSVNGTMGSHKLHDHINEYATHDLSELPEDEEVTRDDTTISDINVSENDGRDIEAPPNDPRSDLREGCKEYNDNSTNVVVVSESVGKEPIDDTEDTTEDIFCAGVRPDGHTSSNNDCASISDTFGSNEVTNTNCTVNGEIEKTSIQELVELDDDNVISVRKLRDLIIEHQLQMPKAVCCDDWLVLDFSHSAIFST